MANLNIRLEMVIPRRDPAELLGLLCVSCKRKSFSKNAPAPLKHLSHGSGRNLLRLTGSRPARLVESASPKCGTAIR
jgi:hypothetical protein